MKKLVPLIIVVVAASGCGSSPKHVGRFIRTLNVSGGDLVLEVCSLTLTGETIDHGDCALERRPLPITARLPSTLTAAQISERITPELDASIESCGKSHAVTGTVRATVAINYAGRLVGVSVDGFDDFADCVGVALSPARFPETKHGAKLSVSLVITP